MSLYATSYNCHRHLYDTSEEDRLRLDLLDNRVLTLLSNLVNNRRPLPICRGRLWRCYCCSFETADFELMVHHIMNVHGPVPFNEEDEIELCELRSS